MSLHFRVPSPKSYLPVSRGSILPEISKYDAAIVHNLLVMESYMEISAGVIDAEYLPSTSSTLIPELIAPSVYIDSTDWMIGCAQFYISCVFPIK